MTQRPFDLSMAVAGRHSQPARVPVILAFSAPESAVFGWAVIPQSRHFVKLFHFFTLS